MDGAGASSFFLNPRNGLAIVIVELTVVRHRWLLLLLMLLVLILHQSSQLAAIVKLFPLRHLFCGGEEITSIKINIFFAFLHKLVTSSGLVITHLCAHLLLWVCNRNSQDHWSPHPMAVLIAEKPESRFELMVCHRIQRRSANPDSHSPWSRGLIADSCTEES